MARTVIGVFDDWTTAERAVDDLVRRGFQREEVSLIANRDRAPDLGPLETVGSSTRDTGAGVAVGGLAGFVAGIAALAIPGIGPVLAAGPLASGIIGATVGAAAGGLIGGLKDLGMTLDEAEQYSEAVKRGGVLISVHASESQTDDAIAVLNHHGAVNIEERAAQWRQEGWVPAGRPDRPLKLDADPGRVYNVPADQTGRTRGEGGGAKVFVW